MIRLCELQSLRGSPGSAWDQAAPRRDCNWAMASRNGSPVSGLLSGLLSVAKDFNASASAASRDAVTR
jgi:hypothetical protein